MSEKTTFIVFGVSGTGKTTIGKGLAKQLGTPFFDADDFHPKNNVDKMASGNPLNDDDRKPWLDQLAVEITQWNKEGGAVLACSALKESYQKILEGDEKVTWVFLQGDFDTIYNRMKNRKNHYMSADMLQSQFDTLEQPSYGIQLSVTLTPSEILQRLKRKIRK